MRGRLRRIGYAPLWWLERVLLGFSLVPVDPYLDPSIMPWASRLEDSWEAIHGELTEVLADGDGTSSVSAVYPDAANIAAADDWTSYFFCSYG